MSIDDLYRFCVKNKFSHFSCDDSNYELCVQMPAKGLFKKEDIDKHKEGLRPFTAKAYHDNVNLNKSEIDPDVFIENTKSAPFRPILANIVENEETGEKDFGSHDFTIEESKDGDQKVIYLEKPVGVIGNDFSFEYDEEQGVNRAILNGYLYEEYCQDAIDILDRRENVDCSIELNIRDMSFNSSSKTLVLNDYYIGGLTLLGSTIKPGMAGSSATLKDFSADEKEVSHFSSAYNELVEALDKLNLKLDNLSMLDINNQSKEGGKNVSKLEELLEKYSKTREDLSFEVEGLTDEELEALFAENFNEAEDDSEGNEDAPSGEGDEGDFKTDESKTIETVDTKEDEKDKDKKDDEDTKKKKIMVECNGQTKTFEVSFRDTIYSLERLVNATYEEDNDYYCVDVFENYVIMHSCCNTNINYKQNYEKNKDEFSLTGERVKVSAHWLTTEEEKSLSDMKKDYALAKEKISAYEKAELDAEKDKVFEAEDYKEYLDKDEFKSLINEKDKYSVSELKDKAEIAFAKCVREFGLSEKNHKEKVVAKRKSLFHVNDGIEKRSPYGNIFK